MAVSFPLLSDALGCLTAMITESDCTIFETAFPTANAHVDASWSTLVTGPSGLAPLLIPVKADVHVRVPPIRLSTQQLLSRQATGLSLAALFALRFPTTDLAHLFPPLTVDLIVGGALDLALDVINPLAASQANTNPLSRGLFPR
jgi:hypothetical protein